MSTFNANSTELYRQGTKDQLWLSHVRKRCACGKVITAKQLQQYGACSACLKAKQLPTNSKSVPVAQSASDIGQGSV